MTVNNNYGDSMGANGLNGAGATAKLSAELSGWIESIYYAFTFSNQSTGGTATPSETMSLQTLAGIINNPQFQSDLNAAAAAGNTFAQNLDANLFKDTDYSGNTLATYFQQMSAGGSTGAAALTALQNQFSQTDDSSLLQNLSRMVSNQTNWSNNLDYQTPVAGDGPNFANAMTSFMSDLSILNGDMTTPPNWSKIDADVQNLLSAYYGGAFSNGLQSYMNNPAYANDGYAKLLKELFGSLQPAGSANTLDSFMSKLQDALNSKNQSAFQALIMNPSNLNDPNTLYNLLYNKTADGQGDHYDNSFYNYLNSFFYSASQYINGEK